MPEKTDKKKFGEELKKFKKQTSVENEESTEVYISNPNNTNLSDTEMNDNKSDRKSTRLNSSHTLASRMPSSA